MTAQQAPHTTPLWRKFLSLPHSRLGWWAVGLVGIYGVLYVLGKVVDDSGGSVVEGLIFGTWALLGVVGAVVALLALLLSHELSALVWLAMVAGLPAFLPLGFIVMVRGEYGEQVGLDPSSTLPEIAVAALVVLITVLICVLIAGLQRYKSGKQR